jgi:hypothetical protein
MIDFIVRPARAGSERFRLLMPGGHRAPAEQVADSMGDLPTLSRGIAQFDRHERRRGRTDFQDRHVVGLVVADEAGVVRVTAVERDADFLGPFDDVVIRQNVAIAIEHRTAAGPFGRDFQKQQLALGGLGGDMHDRAVGLFINQDVGSLFGGVVGQLAQDCVGRVNPWRN